MYIIVAGGGLVGRSIIKELNKNHDVVLIEKKREVCEKISSEYGVVTILGNAANIRTLKEAGIKKCDYALGVMGNDKDNLLFALLCKNFNVNEVFVRMKDPEYIDAYKIAGATNIGHSVDMMVKKFVYDIEQPEIKRIASLRNGKAEVAIISIGENTKLDGKLIEEVVKEKNFPDNLVIAAIFNVENNELIIPRGNKMLKSGTELFLVGSEEDIKNAYKFFKKYN